MKETERARLALTAELFKALGHPDRLAMLEKLSGRKWCVCELARELGLNKSVASKHLSLLFDLGMLDMEKQGTLVLYSLAVPCVVEMSQCSWLAIQERQKKRYALD
jgi:ArsR family transcriptional regulator